MGEENGCLGGLQQVVRCLASDGDLSPGATLDPEVVL